MSKRNEFSDFYNIKFNISTFPKQSSKNDVPQFWIFFDSDGISRWPKSSNSMKISFQNIFLGNAEISSSDSGNEVEKCVGTKKSESSSPSQHISNNNKDADMRSDSSDSCSKEVFFHSHKEATLKLRYFYF